MSKFDKLIGCKICDYTIKKYINSGSFGNVFEAVSNTTNDPVAIKIPSISKCGEKWLLEEGEIYKQLKGTGVPNAKVEYSEKFKTNILVMDLLGSSLNDVFRKNKKGIPLDKIILLMIHILKSIRTIHESGFIHRDLKPSNFVFNKDFTQLYCIDYGLTKRYAHQPHPTERRSCKSFCGTAKFASISAHEYKEQFRKDDLESVLYTIVYLFNGKLPWQNEKRFGSKNDPVLHSKQTVRESEAEFTKGMPKEFYVYYKYINTLDFDEMPLYKAMIRMFEKLYKKIYNTPDIPSLETVFGISSSENHVLKN